MKTLKSLWLAAAILVAATAGAMAQATTQVLPGYLSSGNCPGGAWQCFVPYGPSNPIPTAGTATPMAGTTSAPLAPSLTEPQSTLTRPANTTAYAGSSTSPQLIGSATAAGSVVVPSFALLNTGSGADAAIPRLTLFTNATTGWGGVTLTITLWTAAPTYSAGDGAAYAVASGTLYQRAQYSCTLIQHADGAVCNAAAMVGNAPVIAPAAGGRVYWDIQIAAAATPISGQTFTLTPEVWN